MRIEAGRGITNTIDNGFISETKRNSILFLMERQIMVVQRGWLSR